MDQVEQVEGFVDNRFYSQASSSDEDSQEHSSSADDTEESDEETTGDGDAVKEMSIEEGNQFEKVAETAEETVEEFEEYQEGLPVEEFQESDHVEGSQLVEEFEEGNHEEFQEGDNIEEFEEGDHVEEFEEGNHVQEFEEMDESAPMQLDDSNSEAYYSSKKESKPSQVPARYNEPAGPSFRNLESFTLNASNQDLSKRTETLLKTGTFFTREGYEAYTSYKLHPESRDLLEVILETEERLKSKRSETKRPMEEVVELSSVKPLPVQPSVEPLTVVKQDPLETPSPTPKKRKVAAPTVLDTVLTDMMRYNKSQSIKQEPSDLEIAAMAAGLQFPHQPTTNQSRFTKEKHEKFLGISDEIKSGSNNVSEADMEMYKYMCTEIKHEQDEFMQEQKKQMNSSGVYNTLDDKVEKMIEDCCEIEYDRILQYPQHYKYFNILNMPPIPHAPANDSPILSFKTSLLQTGKIAPCKPSALETPRRLDLFKKYIVVPPKDEDEIDIEEEDDTYYKKTFPPTVSHDKNITHLLQTNKADIVIAPESLIALVGLIHDISVDLCLPMKVVEKDGVRTLIFDRPLPREEMTARERNQIIYDLTFKSLCLDWTKRHDISSIVDENAHKEYATEENLQYNMWTFGDMNILIRHQADGEIAENTSKKSGSKERRVYLTSKLDYQISDGREEITTPNERSANWLRSYIGGHATVLEGRIDVVNNRLLRVDRKEMVDIMGGQWRPMLESELLRHTFSKLHKMLSSPGNYLLQHKKDDRNFLIFQSSQVPGDVDLLNRRKIPILSKTEKSFIPAWSAIENQIPWTFPPK